jgi:hypothetical protein
MEHYARVYSGLKSLVDYLVTNGGMTQRYWGYTKTLQIKNFMINLI